MCSYKIYIYNYNGTHYIAGHVPSDGYSPTDERPKMHVIWGVE
jgi:hypothetical protein